MGTEVALPAGTRKANPVKVSLLIRGLIMGFSIAAPVGPIGVLCIRRTLSEGWAAGLVSGLGAATADAFYGAIAGFGLTFVSTLLIDQQDWLRPAGGLFLCYLAVKTLLTRPSDRSAPSKGRGLLGAYVSTFLLTLTNPITILSFAAVFAGLGAASAGAGYGAAAVLVLGVFAGSALWWLLLSGGVGLLRAKFRSEVMLWLNRISGLVILGFGLYALIGWATR